MTTRRLEIMEDELLLGTTRYYKGDIKSFPVELADEMVKLGWAKDVVTGEQGERKPGANGPIQPDKLTTVMG